MKAAVCRAPNVLVCMLGSGTLLAPPSLKTATHGNWGYTAWSTQRVWEGKLGQEGQDQVDQKLAWVESRGWGVGRGIRAGAEGNGGMQRSCHRYA